jgi:hypothetical protein
MKATKPPRESASARAYRNTEVSLIVTDPALKQNGTAALALLNRDGAKTAGGPNPGDTTWRLTTETAGGVAFDISLTGPDLPSAVPDETTHPALIPKERPWTGEYRLIVTAPLIVYDIYWKSASPLRIMNFSRGDWEAELAALAAA